MRREIKVGLRAAASGSEEDLEHVEVLESELGEDDGWRCHAGGREGSAEKCTRGGCGEEIGHFGGVILRCFRSSIDEISNFCGLFVVEYSDEMYEINERTANAKQQMNSK